MSKIVLITGATSGIGRATAQWLSENGYVVYGTGRSVAHEDLPFKLIRMDVRDGQCVIEAVQRVVAQEKRIDVLINNAGVGITGAVEELPEEALQNVFQTNLFGAIRVIQAVLPYMRNQKSGLIINITSIAGYMGLPFRGGYSASKGALVLISEALRMELKNTGIHVTTIAPGDYATDIASRRYHAPVKANSPYREVYQKSLDLMNQHVDSGGNPIEMAKKIHRIIETKHLKVHYSQGSFLQKFSVILKRILPAKWYEKMLMNHYQLD
ncbi:SDR family oxidoreductase [Capnocytophaga canimorsus]|uniref:3-oxoacyl-[acyl-carrier-protein] reductase n=1 Tax=Capnocytophaga canimorsus (strain 5) TaxID=860228 RepID=F9YSL9_CAPCC|nr:SDR family oxidoreductase [Capnocytophaga canimorsus]AEK22692.1 Putative 3-oxoacyl-[acyl-carrier-protein] reductase [Capnocytophaga canimorsus Cc5]